MKSTQTLLDLFEHLPKRPCDEAQEWAVDREADEAAWLACERGDHLLWIAEVLGVERKLLVLAACDCAERALRFARPEDVPVLRETLRVPRAWTRGEATIGEVRAAAEAAAVVKAAEAAWAAWAATAEAAWAAWAAARAAEAAAGTGAAWAAARAAEAAEHRACADVVRRHITWAVVAARLGREARRPGEGM